MRGTVISFFLVLFVILGSSLVVSWFILSLERAEYETLIDDITNRDSGRLAGVNLAIDKQQTLIDETNSKIGTVDKEETAQWHLAEANKKFEFFKKERVGALARWAEGEKQIADAWGSSSGSWRGYQDVPETPAPPDPVNIEDLEKFDLKQVSEQLEELQRDVRSEAAWRAERTGGLLKFWKEKNQEIRAEDELIRRLRRDFFSRRQDLRRDLDQRKAELADAQRKYKNTNKESIKEIAELARRDDRVRERLEHEEEKRIEELKVKEADGKVLSVGGTVADKPTNFCVINIGWADGVRRNMKFVVFHQTPSGRRVTKGMIQIQEARAKTSNCVILPQKKRMPVCPQTGWEASSEDMLYSVYATGSEGGDEAVRLKRTTSEILVPGVNPLNPIMPGDRISNPHFSVSKKPDHVSEADWQLKRIRMLLSGDITFNSTLGDRQTFVLAGVPLHKSRREIRLFIAENGGILQDELTLNTNFFIVGTGPEVNKMVDDARELGVRVIRETELYELFGAGE